MIIDNYWPHFQLSFLVGIFFSRAGGGGGEALAQPCALLCGPIVLMVLITIMSA